MHWPDAGPAQLLPVATCDDQGKISLDFGDRLPGTGHLWCDVLRVTSAAPESLRVTFATDGATAAFVGRVWLASGPSPDRLDPDETRSVAVRFAVPRTTAPGTYDGTLVVAVAGGTERHEFPMTVTIVGARPCPSPSPSGTPTDALEPADAPSPEPSPSASSSSSPSPEPSPAPALLFTLEPGLTTVLSGQSPEAPVAQILHDGTLALDFGEVPADEATIFADVARMTSAAGETAGVTLALSGPAAAVVQRVGFSDGAGGIVCDDLTLAAGETAQLAFGFDLGADSPCGLQQGTLTVIAELDDGSVQQCELPLTVTVLPIVASPSPSASASPSPTASPRSQLQPQRLAEPVDDARRLGALPARALPEPVRRSVATGGPRRYVGRLAFKGNRPGLNASKSEATRARQAPEPGLCILRSRSPPSTKVVPLKLIVTEKNIAAKKLAEILAVGKPKTDKVYNTPVYTFRRDGEDWMSIGLKGHILGVDFPQQIVFGDGTWDAVWEDDAIEGAGRDDPRARLVPTPPVAARRSRSRPTAST